MLSPSHTAQSCNKKTFSFHSAWLLQHFRCSWFDVLKCFVYYQEKQHVSFCLETDMHADMLRGFPQSGSYFYIPWIARPGVCHWFLRPTCNSVFSLSFPQKRLASHSLLYTFTPGNQLYKPILLHCLPMKSPPTAVKGLWAIAGDYIVRLGGTF